MNMENINVEQTDQALPRIFNILFQLDVSRVFKKCYENRKYV